MSLLCKALRMLSVRHAAAGKIGGRSSFRPQGLHSVPLLSRASLVRQWTHLRISGSSVPERNALVGLDGEWLVCGDLILVNQFCPFGRSA
jgi:hypothetical protein